VQPVRVPEADDREVRRRRAEPDQREVGRRVASHELGVEAAAVRQAHLDGAPALDDVVVGHHQARALDDEARAAPFLLRWSPGAEEPLVPWRQLRGPDHRQAHDARADALDQRREGRERDLRRGDRALAEVDPAVRQAGGAMPVAPEQATGRACRRRAREPGAAGSSGAWAGGLRSWYADPLPDCPANPSADDVLRYTRRRCASEPRLRPTPMHCGSSSSPSSAPARPSPFPGTCRGGRARLVARARTRRVRRRARRKRPRHVLRPSQPRSAPGHRHRWQLRLRQPRAPGLRAGNRPCDVRGYTLRARPRARGYRAMQYNIVVQHQRPGGCTSGRAMGFQHPLPRCRARSSHPTHGLRVRL
jgi:hypothetical protein